MDKLAIFRIFTVLIEEKFPNKTILTAVSILSINMDIPYLFNDILLKQGFPYE